MTPEERKRITKYNLERLKGKTHILPDTSPSLIAKKVGCGTSSVKKYILKNQYPFWDYEKKIQAEFNRLFITEQDLECARIIIRNRGKGLWEF